MSRRRTQFDPDSQRMLEQWSEEVKEIFENAVGEFRVSVLSNHAALYLRSLSCMCGMTDIRVSLALILLLYLQISCYC